MAVKQNVKIIIATGVIVLSALFLYSFFGGFGPPVDVTTQKALGKFLATEALKLRGPDGKILLLSPDTSAEANPYADAQMRAFERTLGKNGATITARRLVRLNPIRVTSVSGAEFAVLLKKSSENDILVSFIGPPVLGAEPASNIPEKHAKILAVCSGGIPRQANLRRAFEQGMLNAAVISRPDAGKTSANTPLEIFNQNFTVVTAANLADLPLAAASRGEK
jgi:hypothetical protein